MAKTFDIVGNVLTSSNGIFDLDRASGFKKQRKKSTYFWINIIFGTALLSVVGFGSIIAQRYWWAALWLGLAALFVPSGLVYIPDTYKIWMISSSGGEEMVFEVKIVQECDAALLKLQAWLVAQNRGSNT